MHFIKNIIKKLTANSYKLKATKGFTLIETLVAISILMIAIASPLTIAQKGVASAIYAKDQIIASYLAQDAIEFIINKSDRNKISGVVEGWLYEILSAPDEKCNKDSSCQVDTTNGAITTCDGACEELKYSNEYSYSYRSGESSGFRRSVIVEEVNPDTEALITVKISWSDKGKHRELTFQTRIFNWKS